MSDKFDYIADRLDKVSEKVDSINTTLATHITEFEAHVEREEKDRVHLIRNTDILQENTVSLQDHMQRTAALERYVKAVDARLSPIELESIHKQAVKQWVKNSIFFIGKLGAALTAVGMLGAIGRYLINHL
jgi:DNA-directed RNA polymerase sigma subunit (sigma70/sigma32)